MGREKCSEPRAGVGERLTDENADEPLQEPHRTATEPAHVVGDGAAFGEPAADDHVGAGIESVEEQLHRERVVLAVGIELHRSVVAVPDREREPGAQRAADPEVERQNGDERAGAAGDRGGVVDGPVRDHEHVVLGCQLSELFEHGRQGLLFVVRGDDDERGHGAGVRAAEEALAVRLRWRAGRSTA